MKKRITYISYQTIKSPNTYRSIIANKKRQPNVSRRFQYSQLTILSLIFQRKTDTLYSRTHGFFIHMIYLLSQEYFWKWTGGNKKGLLKSKP